MPYSSYLSRTLSVVENRCSGQLSCKSVLFKCSVSVKTVADKCQGLALYYVGFYIRFDPPLDDTPISASGYVALIAIYIFAAVYQFGWGPVVWTYCSVCALFTDLLFAYGHLDKYTGGPDIYVCAGNPTCKAPFTQHGNGDSFPVALQLRCG